MRAISGTASTLVSSSALQAKFKGHVLHSSQYRNIKGYENKNVVVGTGDSGKLLIVFHTISLDSQWYGACRIRPTWLGTT